MIITLFLLLWFVVIGVNVWTDRKGRKPNYLVMFFLRGIAAIAHGSLLFRVQDNLEYVPLFLFQVSSYWLLFELALNMIQKRPLLYYDIKERDSGWIDRFFAWTGPTFHSIAKVVTLFVMIFSIIKIYNYSWAF